MMNATSSTAHSVPSTTDTPINHAFNTSSALSGAENELV